MTEYEKLDAWVDAHFDEEVKFLQELVRFASCVLCGDSKRLEALAAGEKEGEFAGQLRGKLGRLLGEVTGPQRQQRRLQRGG